MPVSFCGLSKGCALNKNKVLIKNTLATGWKEEDFLLKSGGLDLVFVQTRFTFARRTKRNTPYFRGQTTWKNKNEAVGYNWKM